MDVSLLVSLLYLNIIRQTFIFLSQKLALVYIAMSPSSTILKKSCFYLDVNVWEPLALKEGVTYDYD